MLLKSIATGSNFQQPIQIVDSENDRRIIHSKFVPITTLIPNVDISAPNDPNMISRGVTIQENPLLNLVKYYKDNIKLDSKTPISLGYIKLAEKLQKNVYELSEEDIMENYELSYGHPSGDIFSVKIGDLISHYEKLKHDNEYKEFENIYKHRDVPYLKDHEFVLKYGKNPSIYINEILKSCDLPYRVVAGREKNGAFHRVAFRNIITNDISGNINISSGEQVLLAIAIATYNLENRTVNTATNSIQRYNLLLLDEPDASLHPSNVKILLDSIQKVFVDHGVNVIMSTHSPSTIALAPEEAKIYLLEKGPTKLTELSRDQAINKLTVGIPTLSVKIENRKVVFVESNYDAENYQSLFTKVKNYLNTDYSLTFVASDITGNGTCEKVEDIVNKLEGLQSVYGLIDHDGKKQETAFLKVLGHGNRNGIENYILDPVILGTYLLRTTIIAKSEVGLSSNENSLSIENFNAERLQAFADSIISLIQNRPNETSLQTTTYLNGISIKIPEWYCKMDDHGLQDLIITNFPALQRLNNRNKLSSEIIQQVIEDSPGLTPIDIVTTFQSILPDCPNP